MQLTTTRPADIARQVNELDALAKTHANKAVDYARQAGELLLGVKAQLPHGQWTDWVEKNLSVSLRQCQRYIAVAQGKVVPVRELAGKSDTVSLLKVPHPVDFKPSWRPTPGHWHSVVWDQAAYWVIPDRDGVLFHVSKLYVEDQSLPESQWQMLFDGTRRAVMLDAVDWYLKSFGLPFADRLTWETFEGEGEDRPFGEPSHTGQIDDLAR